MYMIGKTKTEIAEKYGVSRSTITKYLKEKNVNARSFIDRLNEKDIKQICDWYIFDDWDCIFKNYPFLNKNRVRHITSSCNITKYTYFWSKEDTDYLINNYGCLSYSEMSKAMNQRHSAKAISKKAIKLGLTSPDEWSDSELNILLNNYSIVEKDKILEMLPDRSEAAIICKAMQLGIKSLRYLENTYSEEDKKTILEKSKSLSDQEISQILNKPLSGIQEQRRKLGIYHICKNYSKYECIKKIFRGTLYDWKMASMKNCNYQCVLTGSKNYEIHHLYSFNMIADESLTIAETNGLIKGLAIDDYTVQELDKIIDIFKDIHKKYPLGVCIDKNIHALFHRIYGSGCNNEEQWDQFMLDYKAGKYDKLSLKE